MRTVSRSFVVGMALALVVAACGDDGSVLGAGGSTTTTEAPPATTEAPPATTEAPPATTGAPPATTEAPPATTEAPPATTEAPPETIERPVPTPPVLTLFDASETSDSPPLMMTVEIPVVSGVPPEAAGAMNDLISAEMLGTADAFKAEVLASELPIDETVPYELMLSYIAESVSAEILSLRFSIYMYYSGGAHGQTFLTTMNFDPQTGRLLSLNDILVPGTIGVVANLVEQHIVDEVFGGDEGEAFEWIPVLDEAALDGWAVVADGLLFSFDQYEVGYGALGAPTIGIPWSELAAVIDPGGYAAVYAFGPG
ncbi:MAG: DUF4163 domain-containing protein [Actinobacteria bacterium]|nr:DUF4163 domain-containing protein [Actinomycetota bacterium]